MLGESAGPHAAELLGEGKGRSRRLGARMQRALPQLTRGCLDSARDLHQGAGWERAPGQGAVVCLKILQLSFASVCPRLRTMPFRGATEGSGPADATKIRRVSLQTQLKKRKRSTTGPRSVVSKLLQQDANMCLTFSL